MPKCLSHTQQTEQLFFNPSYFSDEKKHKLSEKVRLLLCVSSFSGFCFVRTEKKGMALQTKEPNSITIVCVWQNGGLMVSLHL